MIPSGLRQSRVNALWAVNLADASRPTRIACVENEAILPRMPRLRSADKIAYQRWRARSGATRLSEPQSILASSRRTIRRMGDLLPFASDRSIYREG